MIGSSRRSKPKIIRRAAGSDEDVTDSSSHKGNIQLPASDIPATSSLKRKSHKANNSPKLRLSFGGPEEDEGSFVPKRSILSRNISSRKNVGEEEDIPSNFEQASISRPTYTKSYLSQLKTSTPSTPKEYQSPAISEKDDPLDIEGKFGMVLGNQSSSIPESGVVKAIKDRRARRAKDGADFISLSENQDLIVSSKKAGPRLVREEDEYGGDGLDGLEEYVDHGIILRKDGEQLLAKKRKDEMRDAIEADEYEESDSDNSAMQEWEQSQIRKGDFTTRETTRRSRKSSVPVPPIVTALPTLAGALSRLRGMMITMQEKKAQLTRQANELAQEMADLLLREKLVQDGLEKASQDYETLQKDVGFIPHRGLDTLADQTMQDAQHNSNDPPPLL
ncbi:hypothetical protein NEOLI_004975 [Neolecta irregularis DAH-3]|uniref:Nineteen complex-related protein 2 n=1 Tax=Neolecta irregularis (strain DAH-3) TaxID=1198029 RepID=A0A1U7LSG0_NEOID|nr:hypothetical protein NEOLI_004975 [Neolecta irregularis DAH-3]|eukprot:OLL25584.1 hypothetical protein NEOLI_004975 [Neolecta irregularis DAH-3]